MNICPHCGFSIDECKRRQRVLGDTSPPPRKLKCAECCGEGYVDGATWRVVATIHECPTCHGDGHILVPYPPLPHEFDQTAEECP